MIKDPIEDTVKRMDRFLLKTGMKEARFGREVANNSSLVARLRSRNPSTKVSTLIAVQRYIEGHKP